LGWFKRGRVLENKGGGKEDEKRIIKKRE